MGRPPTDRQWETWATRDPYFAVLSAEEFRGGGSRDKFFASGEQHVAHVLAEIRAHLAPGFAPQTALDFGCGVGRVAIPLARLCRTTGVDVSASMLAEARRNAAALGASAHFSEQAEGSFDLVHSFIVFQHIPARRGLELTRELLAKVAPGGVAVLHYVYGSARHPLVKAINWLRYRVTPLHYATNVLRGRPLLDPPMQMNTYELRELLPLFREFTLRLEFGEHGGYLGCVFYARRDL